MWKANKCSYFQEQWTHSECCVSLQKFPNGANLNPIRLRSLPRWELSAWLKNRVQNPQWRPQTSTSHTKTHTERQTRTHDQRRGSVCSAQSCCLQVDESVRTESSVVVLYCYWPEAPSSSINDAQQAVGHIPSLSSLVCTVSLPQGALLEYFHIIL